VRQAAKGWAGGAALLLRAAHAEARAGGRWRPRRRAGGAAGAGCAEARCGGGRRCGGGAARAGVGGTGG